MVAPNLGGARLSPATVMSAMAKNGFQVNGSLRTSQQNGTTALAANGAYPADNFYVAWTSSVALSHKLITSGPFTSMPLIKNAIEIEVTTADATVAAGDFALVVSKIEGRRLANEFGWGSANAKPISIGWMLRSNISGRAYLRVTNNAENRSRVFPIDLVANTDKYAEINIPGDQSGTWLTDTGVGIQVGVTFQAGTTYQTTAGAWQVGNLGAASDVTNFCATIGNKLWIGPMVVMPGNDLPPVENLMSCFRLIEDEEHECLRLWRMNPACSGDIYAPNTAYIMGATTPFRIAPVLTLVNPTGTFNEFGVGARNISSISSSAASASGDFSFNLTMSGGTAGNPGGLSANTISMSARF